MTYGNKTMPDSELSTIRGFLDLWENADSYEKGYYKGKLDAYGEQSEHRRRKIQEEQKTA